MRGAATNPEMKTNMYTGFFLCDQICSVKVCDYAWWEVTESSTLALILETATRKLIRYLSGRDVSSTSGLPLFP